MPLQKPYSSDEEVIDPIWAVLSHSAARLGAGAHLELAHRVTQTPERRRRGRSDAERRQHRNEIEREWHERQRRRRVTESPAPHQGPPSPATDDGDDTPQARVDIDRRAMEIIEQHRDNHPTKTKIIPTKQSRPAALHDRSMSRAISPSARVQDIRHAKRVTRHEHDLTSSCTEMSSPP